MTDVSFRMAFLRGYIVVCVYGCVWKREDDGKSQNQKKLCGLGGAGEILKCDNMRIGRSERRAKSARGKKFSDVIGRKCGGRVRIDMAPECKWISGDLK